MSPFALERVAGSCAVVSQQQLRYVQHLTEKRAIYAVLSYVLSFLWFTIDFWTYGKVHILPLSMQSIHQRSALAPSLSSFYYWNPLRYSELNPLTIFSFLIWMSCNCNCFNIPYQYWYLDCLVFCRKIILLKACLRGAFYAKI